jgi:hypothetical protein
MKRFSPLLSHWHGEVKQLFTLLHGHQKKVLVLFVLGAIRTESIVVQRVAEELLSETQAKVPSIERRLQRFLSNERVEVEPVWEQFLAQVLPFWRGKEVTLVLDSTPFEEYAQVVYVGLVQQARVLPLAWKVMPGQQEWEQGQWELVAQLCERVESTFQDMKRRGWQWESSHVRQLDRLERLLLVLFLVFWWLIHLAASCVHSGRRDRYDRHDRRDKGHLRLGRLYLRASERGGYDGTLRQCLPLRRHHQQWRFCLRF